MTKRNTDPNEAAREERAKGSVKEAIGKLIGDDAIRDAGAAEKHRSAHGRAAPEPQRKR